jgi:hypothetical protein
VREKWVGVFDLSGIEIQNQNSVLRSFKQATVTQLRSGLQGIEWFCHA